MNSESGKCEFCNRSSNVFVSKEEAGEDIYVCTSCQRLLKSPETALPLIRGHLSLEARENGTDKKQINKFMEMISSWHRRN